MRKRSPYCWSMAADFGETRGCPDAELLSWRTRPVLPFDHSEVNISQLSYERFQRDKGHLWTRALVYKLFHEHRLAPGLRLSDRSVAGSRFEPAQCELRGPIDTRVRANNDSAGRGDLYSQRAVS